MKTTKTEDKEVTLCDDCKKNEVTGEDEYGHFMSVNCECCKKDLCKDCSAYKQDYDLPLICKACFDKFPKFVQENMDAVLRSPDEGGDHILTSEFRGGSLVFDPESYKQKGFYIFVVGHEDGSCVRYCKNKEEISRVMDKYSSEDNEDIPSDIYDENGKRHKMSRTVELKEI